MRFMVIRKADAETESFTMPSQKLIDDMTSYNEELVHAGIMKGGDGLMPTSRGARVSFSGGKPSVIDGPFTEAKELIAGYSIIEAPSLRDAIEIVKRWPAEDAHGNAQLEIRQIITAEDMGFSDEQAARAHKLREESEQQQQQ